MKKRKNPGLFSKTQVLAKMRIAIKQLRAEKAEALPNKKDSGCSDIEACIQCAVRIYEIVSKAM